MSLLDKPKINLSPALFMENEKMRPDVRIYIFEDINSFLQPGTIAGVYLLGSMAGRQYNEESDIDIELVLRPGLKRENYKEYVKKFNGRLLPGTKHPINYYVTGFSEPQ
jgi:predicted nucleotidyltransferase